MREDNEMSLRTMLTKSMLSLSAIGILLAAGAAQSAPCFGSEAWSTFGASGLCLTTSRTAFAAAAGEALRIDFASNAGDTAVQAGGVDVLGRTPVGDVPEVIRESIGSADYDPDETFAGVPIGRQLTAGPLSELFIGRPEIPAGTVWTPALASELIPAVGLRVGLQIGTNFNMDFDDFGSRPTFVSTATTLPFGGTVGLHVLLGNPGGPADLLSDRVLAIPVDSTFLGISAAPGTDIARLRWFLASGNTSSFDLTDVAYSSTPIPEPSTTLLIGAGLVALSASRRRSTV